MTGPARVLLIALPGAEWETVSALVDAGAMPAMAGLIERGTFGKMTSVAPDGTAPALVSLITGLWPHQHRILTDHEGDGAALRPVTSQDLRGPALWDMLTAAGVPCQAHGWPAAHPAAVLSAAVSDRFEVDGATRDAVAPPALAPELADLRIGADELTVDDLRFWMPGADFAALGADPRVAVLADLVARTASLHAAATACLEDMPWRFAAVAMPGLSRISHLFAPWHPPQLDGVTPGDAAAFGQVVRAAYVFHDMMLAALIALAGPGMTVIVASHTGEALGPRRERITGDGGPGRFRPGLFAMAGPGVRRDTIHYGASILDIAPTVLHLFGRPAHADMPGRVLIRALEGEPTVAPRVPAAARAPETPRTGPLADLRNRGDAKSRIAAGRHIDAIPLLEALIRGAPHDQSLHHDLINCRLALHRPDLAMAALDRMFDAKKRDAPAALAQWRDLDARGDYLSPAEAIRKAELWKRSRSNLAGMAQLRARILHAQGASQAALDILTPAVEAKVNDRAALIRLRFECLRHLGRSADAEAEARRLLEVDPDGAEAALTMAGALYDRRDWSGAADMALEAVRRRYFLPAAHLVYGSAIFRCGRADLAADAIKVAVALDAGLAMGWARLALLYAGPLADPEAASDFAAKAQALQAARPAAELKRTASEADR
ncbi:MAG: putative AlkP superfamily phosphohydrolase/phosphomutase/tetratricopeptide (TPR) repeat protein [Paracoccaceae bacterium]|jgi:predicted AlkP superfamily phosphohydrolase/phosphomutase/tetratricopeptide (TPR) repeat protein